MPIKIESEGFLSLNIYINTCIHKLRFRGVKLMYLNENPKASRFRASDHGFEYFGEYLSSKSFTVESLQYNGDK